ncbi:MAG: hypothetical protein IT359_04610 [Gemmatimonadaceae bacterium]|nr:hypothetical protein [Gemmatimonadaceae bacterium]
MSHRATVDTPPRPFEVAIVGNDAVLAALPARPIQLAHAILACGYDLVVPVSWGEEVLAEHTLRAIAARGSAPAIFCACPALRARLLAAGNELAPYLISVVSPAVAAARYLRALHAGAPLRITTIGGCPSARDDSIDTRIGAHDFLRLLVNRGVSLTRQPAVFDSVLPPDRRRYFSLPGGCPAPKALVTRAPDRRLVTITDDAFSTDLAELLLSGENVLIDLSPRLGCTCCGGPPTGDHWGPSGRDEILLLEPPRARTPVIDLEIEVSVDVAPTDPSARPELPLPGSRPAHGGRATPETIRLPGASPIAEARARAEERGERRRIAITPPAAMPARSPAVDSPASGRTPSVEPAPPRKAEAPSVTPSAPSVTPSAPPLTSSAPLEPPAGPSLRTPAATIARNPALSAPELHPFVTRAGTYAELGMPSSLERAAPTPVSAHGPPESPAPHDSEVVEPVSIEPEVRQAGRRGGVPQRFHLSRASSHPRAQSGGRTLPRAYIRHTPVGVRPTEVVSVEESELLLPVVVESSAPPVETEPAGALSPVEVALEVEVEVVAEVVEVVSAELVNVEGALGEETALEVSPEELAPSELAPSELAPSEVAPRELPPHEVAPVEPATVKGELTTVDNAPMGVAREVLAPEAPPAPARPPMPPAFAAPPLDLLTGEEALARLRRHAQLQRASQPPRIVAREVPPPRERRSLGSLLRFVALAIAVVALLVVLAIVFLRAPTAPW